MPYKDINKRREARMKSYYKHREKSLQKQKDYDSLRNQTQERKDYIKNYQLEHPYETRIASWKAQGMILRETEDWESIWCYYTCCNNCELCDDDISNDKHLDHDHSSGYIRNVLCRSCNLNRVN